MADALSSDTSQQVVPIMTGYTGTTRDGSATTLPDEIVERLRSPLRAAHRDSRTRHSPRTA